MAKAEGLNGVQRQGVQPELHARMPIVQHVKVWEEKNPYDMEIHHRDGDQKNNRYTNLVLLHAYYHDQAHAGTYN